MPERLQKIIIADDKHRLPYSKGLMATSIMATGLQPETAYRIASLIHETLRDEGNPEVTMNHVRDTAERIMGKEVGSKYVEVYKKWQSLSQIKKPIIILVGGATGVGKSTIATMLSTRLGITRQVSTDIIREVMRSLFSKSLVPALYNSSFNAFESLRLPFPSHTDEVILGFLEQAAMVLVGIRALIERAIVEGTNFIVEGAHVVPGILEPEYFEDAFVVHFILTVKSPEQHRSNFEIREVETEGSRPFGRYVRNLDNIRKIQDYIIELARQENVPTFESHNLDTTVGDVIEYVIDQVLQQAPVLSDKTA